MSISNCPHCGGAVMTDGSYNHGPECPMNTWRGGGGAIPEHVASYTVDHGFAYETLLGRIAATLENIAEELKEIRLRGE